MEKPGRKHPRDPAERKARDTARQRKVVSGHSDKGARAARPKIRASENRKVRHADKIAVRTQDPETVGGMHDAALKKRLKIHPTANAAKRRTLRSKERAFLDETAGQTPKGRRRAASFRLDLLKNENLG